MPPKKKGGKKAEDKGDGSNLTRIAIVNAGKM